MPEWERLLGIPWPADACDRSGECCRGAGQVAPWSRLLVQAAQGDPSARAFLNQFIPYPSAQTAQLEAPDAWAASVALLRNRGEDPANLVLYRCRFLEGRNACMIYEDRPQLCRDFPESPFGAVARCCGYFSVAQACQERVLALKAELARLKKWQSMVQSHMGQPQEETDS